VDAALTARLTGEILDIDHRWKFPAAAPVTVLFGPSGSGKTTLLRCLAGLSQPGRGSRIEFDGQRWLGPSARLAARKRGVGMLFQDHALFPHLDVAGNVSYGLRRLPRTERPGRVAEALAAAGAGHLAEAAAGTLSGGEAQRVALARALVLDPAILLMDEPFGALDAFTRDEMNLLLQEIWLETGKTIVFITHNIAEAVFLADRIMVMSPRPGRLASVFEVDLPRPRPLEATTRPHFIELVSRIKASIDHGAGAHAGSIVEMDG
jgi:ABC-type nitrate/sulfonate/bicarbonate transport system ATPase subunit